MAVEPKKIEKITSNLSKLCSQLDLSDDEEDKADIDFAQTAIDFSAPSSKFYQPRRHTVQTTTTVNKKPVSDLKVAPTFTNA